MKSAPRCVIFLHWFPIIVVLLVFVWGAYAYIVQMCFYMVPLLVEKVIYLVFFLLLMMMSLWCFLKATLSQNAKVPYQFYLSNDELKKLKDSKNESNEVIEVKGLKLRVQQRTMQGGIRYCPECKCIKPDRAHHCSTCQSCILRMDHHCPWINNCVCYSNYKYFFLFLFYSSIFSLFISLTSLQYFFKFWETYSALRREYILKNQSLVVNRPTSQPINKAGQNSPSSSTPPYDKLGGLNVIFLTPISFVLFLAIFSLFVYHCKLVASNQTTLESLRSPIFRSGPDRSAYNKGSKKNFIEVFGRNPILALLPLNTDLGDGITFSPRISPIPVGYRSLDTTPNNHHMIDPSSSAAITPDVTTAVVAIQPENIEER